MKTDPIQFNQDQLDAAASVAKREPVRPTGVVPKLYEIPEYNPAAVLPPAGVGDVNSNEKGSGARYNTGKPDLSLIPLTLLAESMLRAALASGADAGSHKFIAAQAMGFLGSFQQTHDPRWLYEMFELLGIDGWEEAAHVFTYGKRKYAAWNWAKGMPWSVPLACAARHVESMWAGVLLDNESHHPHRGHVFCNGIMLIQYGKTYPEGNDLPPAGLL